MTNRGSSEGPSGYVDKAQYAFSTIEELGYCWYAEPFHKSVPDIRAHSITKHDLYIMLLVVLTGRVGKEIAGCFPNIDKGRRFGVANFGPEPRSGELLAKAKGDT